MDAFTRLLGETDEARPDPVTTPATQRRQPPRNAFDRMLEGPSPQDAALGSNLLGAAATTPDAHQKAVDVGKTIGAPADSVAGNMPEAERQAKVRRYHEALNDAPALARLLAEDPDIAKLAADDLPVLAKTESTLGNILSAFYGTTPGNVQAAGDLGRSAVGGLVGDVAGSGLSGLSELNQVAARTIERGMRAVGLDTAADILTEPALPWWLNPTGILKAPGETLKETGGAIKPPEERQNLATDIAGGVGQVAGQIALALLTGGTATTAMLLGQGADIMAERVEEAGQSGTAEGDTAIVAGAGVTAVLEKLGLDALLHRVPPAVKNTILRQLTDISLAGGIEALEEAGEGILHNLIEMVTVNPDAKLLEGLEQDMAAGGGTGAVVRALINAATKGRQISHNAQRQQRAGQDAATVEALVNGTADSKLRDRNPDAFSRVMAAQTQGTPVETFYVPATAIAELYQSGAGAFDDDPLNQIDGLREQIAEALAVGGDVEISAADYLTHIAPTDVHGKLKNDLRASRDGWSVNDAKQYAENPDREADLAALVEKLALENEGAAVGQTVFDDVYKQLMDTGQYESRQAAAQATLAREKAIARAARRGLGEDADALYLRDQLKISGPGALARVQRGDLDLVIARLKSGETVTADKTPVLDIVRKAGGVKVGSQLEQELRAMGLTPKTHPGLFKRKGGIGDVDNFVLSEHDVLRDNGVPESGNGYADKDAVLEALRREAGGRGAALLTQDERTQQHRLDEPVAVLIEQLEAAGLDPNAMTAEEIKAWASGVQATDTAPADGQGVLLQAVATLTGEEIIAADASPEEIRNAARGWYKANLAGTTVTSPDLGEIAFVARGLKKAVNASADTLKLRLFPALRAIMEQGQLVDTVPNNDPTGFPHILRYHFIEASVVVGAETVRVRVNVEERTDGKIYYNHTMPERRELFQGGAQVQSPSRPGVPSDQAELGRTPGERRGTDGAFRTEVIGTGPSGENLTNAGDDVNLTIVEQSAGGNGVRGSFTPKRAQDPHSDPANIIKLTQNADLSTFLHEGGHFYLFQLIDDATDADVPAEAKAKLQADLQAILDHVGVKVDAATATSDQIHAAMTRDAHELWARSFEVYLREGKAPSASLRDAFASFSAWLTRIYRTLKSIPDYRKNLTPEVRGVMDRLLATDEAIKDAQASSSFRVPSALRTVMTAAEQKSLERLTEQANREATEDLRKRVMKELERERLEWWKEERAKVRAEVERDVRSRPVYRAYNIIRTGQTADGGQLVDENGEPRAMKLDRKTLERDYGKDVIKLLPKGLTAKDGASHHVVANLTGFGSADELRDALMNFQPMKDVVEAETEAAMKARHGDMLSDGRLAEDAAELVLNEKQLELAALQARALRRLASSVVKKAAGRLASEQGVQSRADDAAAVGEAQRDVEAVANAGAPAEAVAGLQVEQAFTEAFQGEAVGVRRGQQAALRQVRSIQTGLDLKAIQAAAKRAVAGKRIEDAQPGKYRAQADRLGRKIEEAIAARDYETAATLKEQQLINLALAKEAQEAQARVEKAVKRFARLRKPDSKLAGATDVDFVGAARAILSVFGLSSPQAGYDEQVWFQKLAENDPAGAVDMKQMIEAAKAGVGRVAARGRTRTQQKPGGSPVAMGEIWRQMTVDEFGSLTDTVDAVLLMGREARSVEMEGERLEIKAAVGEMLAQASGRDSGKRIGQTEAVTPWEKRARSFWGTAAFLERTESWARRMDDGKVGPFTKYLVRPVLSAVYEYRAEKTRRIKQLVDILEPRKKELLGKPIHSNELNYTFANKGALLHAILHSGNDSNFRKLLLGGRGKGFAWGKAMPDGSVDRSRWDSMIRRFVQEGVLTKADFDTAQQIWDLLEELKGPAQIAHRKMKGFYFNEVEVTGIDTPFGRYKGGYVPAVSDRMLNPDAGARVDANAMGDMANAGILPSVAKGFTKARVEYNQPLELNISRLTGHMDTVLKFTHLGPTIRNVTRLAINREFRQEMFGIDAHAIDEVLIPWLQRVARQTVEIPPTSDGARTAAKFFKSLQKHTGIAAMAGNLLNALQQTTGISVAMVRVKPHRVLRGLVSSTFAPRHSSQMIQQKSPYMRDRMDSTSMELMTTLEDLLEAKSVFRKIRDKTDTHGYFAQIRMQNLVDKAVWLGSYEQGIAAGKTEAEAVLEADSVVRTTQGSFAPEDVSRVEVQNAFARPFVQFYSYFNAQYNLLRTEFDATVQDLGWVGGSPRLFYIYLVGAMIPAVLADAMMQAARGELGDDDDDGLLDDIGELFGMSQLRYFAAMVPGAGIGVNFAIHLFNDKPYDDRLSVAPVISQLERLGGSAVKLATGGESTAGRAVQDALTIISMLTGLPVAQAGKPLGYFADVATGEQEGDDLGDWARGLLSGREAPRQ
jgi:hypothetical protein